MIRAISHDDLAQSRPNVYEEKARFALVDATVEKDIERTCLLCLRRNAERAIREAHRQEKQPPDSVLHRNSRMTRIIAGSAVADVASIYRSAIGVIVSSLGFTSIKKALFCLAR